MDNLNSVRKAIAYYLTELPVRFLARTPVTPNIISWFGFVLALGAALLIAFEQFIAAGFVVLVAGFFDMIDGALARYTSRVSRFGAVLDATLDRLSEAVLLLGIIVLYVRGGVAACAILAVVALMGSFLVSYIRAKAETLGLECQVGLFTRGERVVVMVLGLWLTQVTEYALPLALALIAVFSFITAGQRLFTVWRQTGNK